MPHFFEIARGKVHMLQQRQHIFNTCRSSLTSMLCRTRQSMSVVSRSGCRSSKQILKLRVEWGQVTKVSFIVEEPWFGDARKRGNDVYQFYAVVPSTTPSDSLVLINPVHHVIQFKAGKHRRIPLAKGRGKEGGTRLGRNLKGRRVAGVGVLLLSWDDR